MHYRWVVVGALVIIGAMSVALAGPITGFFIPVMHEDLGIALFYFGIAMSSRQLCFALVSPFLGRMIDRYGARGLLLLVGLFAGLLVVSLSLVTSGWHLVVIIGLLGIIGLQGAGGDLFGGVVLAKWFGPAERGRAMSIAFIGVPLGILVLSPTVQYGIDTVGWQTTWQILGAGGALLMLVAAALIRPSPMETRPLEDLPDPMADVSHWTREQALRSPTFWKLAVSFGILMFTISTVAMFRVPHFIDRGIDAQWVAIAFSVEAVISAIIAIPIGLLVERFAIHKLTAFGFSFAITMMLITIHTNTVTDVFLATATFGLGAASIVIMQNTIWPQYFGSLHIGAIRGVAMPVTLGFAVIGAPLAGWVRDTTGSFTSIWWATIALMVVAIGLILTTPQPAAPDA